jgi:LDH2 family malate/lactate/ureidoglycolate dehydrogenase
VPAGGHKGSALALLAEILGGLVAGAGCAALGADPGNGLVLIAVHPAPTGVDALVHAVRGAPPAPGFDRVRAPGDPEAETEDRRRRDGIPVPDATWDDFAAVGARYGVALT